jgi:uncharacterized protein YbaR (Trm112 family)
MEKLTTKIMNSFENFLEKYDTCSKMKMVYNWQQLEREIKDILEDVEADRKVLTGTGYICPHCKEDLGVNEITEQIIKCDCGCRYYMDYLGRITSIIEKDYDSWGDNGERRWRCGCEALLGCANRDHVITCGDCGQKYHWDDKIKRLTQVTDVWLDKTDTFIDPEKVYEYDKKMKEQFYKVTLKNSKSN